MLLTTVQKLMNVKKKSRNNMIIMKRHNPSNGPKKNIIYLSISQK